MRRNLQLPFVLASLLVPGAAMAQTTTTLPQPPAPPADVAPPAKSSGPSPSEAVNPPELPAPPALPPPPVAPAEPAPRPSATVSVSPVAAPSPIELTSLRLMREKGLISKAEYESAIHDVGETSGKQAGDASVMFGKWATTLYGFIETDSIWDSTRSFNEVAGGSVVSAYNSVAGANSRFTLSVRNSRLGFRLKAPEFQQVRASGTIETDFFGTQLAVQTGPYPAQVSPSPYGTEGAVFSNSVLRVRHMYLKIETPVVDVLFGQYWSLFGWGSSYQPNSVELQGLPGEVYARTPQLRISKTIKAKPVSLELAVAAMRPVQRDSGTPDGQAGIKFNVDSWTGQQTTGGTGTQIAPLSIAVSSMLRHVALNNFNVPSSNLNTTDLTTSAFAIDAFVPLFPATKESKDNAFAVQGEFTSGYGDADMFSSLTGGIGFPSPTTGTYSPDIDPGIVTFDGKGGLHGIQWTTYLFGAQYYFPGTGGKFWLSGNYSHSESANSHFYTFGASNASKIRAAEDWFDVNAFVDPAPGLRFGLEYANFNDTAVNGIHAINHRLQFSGFFIF